jgi:hypothetical protein
MDGMVECLRCGAPIPHGALACPKCPARTADQPPRAGLAARAPEAQLEHAHQHLVWALGHPQLVGLDGIRRARELYDFVEAQVRRRQNNA